MIETLLPPGVIAVETFTDVPGEPVYPGEEDLVARAVPKRRNEFVTARRCAREALARLGFPPAPIRSGPRREPLWPDGVVGSITHCAGYRAAAVARAGDVTGIGIDAEPAGDLPEGVRDSVTVPAELPHLRDLTAADPSIPWERLLFSAKESVYKAWYPITGRWLGFADARLDIDPAGSFTASILVEGPIREMRGRFRVTDGLVVTAVVVA